MARVNNTPTIVFDNAQMRSMRFSKVLQLLMVVEGGPVVKIYQAGPYRVGAIEPAIAMKKKLIESTSRSLGLTQAGRKRGAINSSVRRGSTSGGPGNRGFEVSMANDTWHIFCLILLFSRVGYACSIGDSTFVKQQ